MHRRGWRGIEGWEKLLRALSWARSAVCSLDALTLNKDSASNSFLSLTLSLRPSPALLDFCSVPGIRFSTGDFRENRPRLLTGPYGEGAAAAEYSRGKQACTKESSTCVPPPCAVLSWSEGLSLSFLSLATRLGPLRRVLQDSEEQLRSCRLGGRCAAVARAVGSRW